MVSMRRELPARGSPTNRSQKGEEKRRLIRNGGVEPRGLGVVERVVDREGCGRGCGEKKAGWSGCWRD